ncbi:lipoprotein localization protein LolB [Vibrio sp. SM6]|uniref:Outer-membrane lipoprotein LolB n=1 Tax=Vibrio agarilyticus TaxID=2726741 RepID=A0A7X8TP81_9VIBR|nr:lipoprotein insertase outer membrane protein LolB [Vibrio agarilyticus]NLS11653.1 lipoprotein localization protein LolB [Vibrio agarilyticus]
MSLKSLIALMVLTPLLLLGCSSVPQSTLPVQWQQHQKTLQQIDQFQVTGKLGYISPEERQSLNFFWHHQPYYSELRLTTVLGQTALKLAISPDGARITTYEDDVFEGQDATSLIYRLTGLRIPVTQLPAWLLGLPQDEQQFTLNDQNTLASLTAESTRQGVTRAPWHIAYQRYRDIDVNGERLPLPSKLQLTQGDIKLNIVITKWTVTP